MAYLATSKLRNKSTHFYKFYHILLFFSSDISISLYHGPCQIEFNDDKSWTPHETRGLRFCHLNVNS